MTLIERIRALLIVRREGGPAVVSLKPADGSGPQINPGPPPPVKVPEGSGPQINPGPDAPVPLSSFPRQGVLRGNRALELPTSSRPFGAARDDFLF